MKIRIEVDGNIKENEIIIRAGELTEDIFDLQNMLTNMISKRQQIIFFKDNIEYYIGLDNILFFETENNRIYGHTINDMYEVKYKLYELEEILPTEFIRVSKSTIINVKDINSINKNITSSSVVDFQNTHKRTYVSRSYFKELKKRIMKVRGYHEK